MYTSVYIKNVERGSERKRGKGMYMYLYTHVRACTHTHTHTHTHMHTFVTQAPMRMKTWSCVQEKIARCAVHALCSLKYYLSSGVIWWSSDGTDFCEFRMKTDTSAHAFAYVCMCIHCILHIYTSVRLFFSMRARSHHLGVHDALISCKRNLSAHRSFWRLLSSTWWYDDVAYAFT